MLVLSATLGAAASTAAAPPRTIAKVFDSDLPSTAAKWTESTKNYTASSPNGGSRPLDRTVQFTATIPSGNAKTAIQSQKILDAATAAGTVYDKNAPLARGLVPELLCSKTIFVPINATHVLCDAGWKGLTLVELSTDPEDHEKDAKAIYTLFSSNYATYGDVLVVPYTPSKDVFSGDRYIAVAVHTGGESMTLQRSTATPMTLHLIDLWAFDKEMAASNYSYAMMDAALPPLLFGKRNSTFAYETERATALSFNPIQGTIDVMILRDAGKSGSFQFQRLACDFGEGSSFGFSMTSSLTKLSTGAKMMLLPTQTAPGIRNYANYAEFHFDSVVMTDSRKLLVLFSAFFQAGSNWVKAGVMGSGSNSRVYYTQYFYNREHLELLEFDLNKNLENPKQTILVFRNNLIVYHRVFHQKQGAPNRYSGCYNSIVCGRYLVAECTTLKTADFSARRKINPLSAKDNGAVVMYDLAQEKVLLGPDQKNGAPLALDLPTLTRTITLPTSPTREQQQSSLCIGVSGGSAVSILAAMQPTGTTGAGVALQPAAFPAATWKAELNPYSRIANVLSDAGGQGLVGIVTYPVLLTAPHQPGNIYDLRVFDLPQFASIKILSPSFKWSKVDAIPNVPITALHGKSVNLISSGDYQLADPAGPNWFGGVTFLESVTKSPSTGSKILFSNGTCVLQSDVNTLGSEPKVLFSTNDTIAVTLISFLDDPILFVAIPRNKTLFVLDAIDGALRGSDLSQLLAPFDTASSAVTIGGDRYVYSGSSAVVALSVGKKIIGIQVTKGAAAGASVALSLAWQQISPVSGALYSSTSHTFLVALTAPLVTAATTYTAQQATTLQAVTFANKGVESGSATLAVQGQAETSCATSPLHVHSGKPFFMTPPSPPSATAASGSSTPGFVNLPQLLVIPMGNGSIVLDGTGTGTADSPSFFCTPNKILLAYIAAKEGGGKAVSYLVEYHDSLNPFADDHLGEGMTAVLDITGMTAENFLSMLQVQAAAVPFSPEHVFETSEELLVAGNGKAVDYQIQTGSGSLWLQKPLSSTRKVKCKPVESPGDLSKLCITPSAKAVPSTTAFPTDYVKLQVPDTFNNPSQDTVNLECFVTANLSLRLPIPVVPGQGATTTEVTTAAAAVPSSGAPQGTSTPAPPQGTGVPPPPPPPVSPVPLPPPNGADKNSPHSSNNGEAPLPQQLTDFPGISPPNPADLQFQVSSASSGASCCSLQFLDKENGFSPILPQNNFETWSAFNQRYQFRILVQLPYPGVGDFIVPYYPPTSNGSTASASSSSGSANGGGGGEGGADEEEAEWPSSLVINNLQGTAAIANVSQSLAARFLSSLVVDVSDEVSSRLGGVANVAASLKVHVSVTMEEKRPALQQQQRVNTGNNNAHRMFHRQSAAGTGTFQLQLPMASLKINQGPQLSPAAVNVDAKPTATLKKTLEVPRGKPFQLQLIGADLQPFLHPFDLVMDASAVMADTGIPLVPCLRVNMKRSIASSASSAVSSSQFVEIKGQCAEDTTYKVRIDASDRYRYTSVLVSLRVTYILPRVAAQFPDKRVKTGEDFLIPFPIEQLFLSSTDALSLSITTENGNPLPLTLRQDGNLLRGRLLAVDSTFLIKLTVADPFDNKASQLVALHSVDVAPRVVGSFPILRLSVQHAFAETFSNFAAVRYSSAGATGGGTNLVFIDSDEREGAFPRSTAVFLSGGGFGDPLPSWLLVSSIQNFGANSFTLKGNAPRELMGQNLELSVVVSDGYKNANASLVLSFFPNRAPVQLKPLQNYSVMTDQEGGLHVPIGLGATGAGGLPPNAGSEKSASVGDGSAATFADPDNDPLFVSRIEVNGEPVYTSTKGNTAVGGSFKYDAHNSYLHVSFEGTGGTTYKVKVIVSDPSHATTEHAADGAAAATPPFGGEFVIVAQESWYAFIERHWILFLTGFSLFMSIVGLYAYWAPTLNTLKGKRVVISDPFAEAPQHRLPSRTVTAQAFIRLTKKKRNIFGKVFSAICKCTSHYWFQEWTLAPLVNGDPFPSWLEVDEDRIAFLPAATDDGGHKRGEGVVVVRIFDQGGIVLQEFETSFPTASGTYYRCMKDGWTADENENPAGGRSMKNSRSSKAGAVPQSAAALLEVPLNPLNDGSDGDEEDSSEEE